MSAIDPTDKVMVRIQLTGTWSYFQNVEMTRADFAKYDKALDGDRREAKRAANEIGGLYVFPRDIEIDDDVELDDFCIVNKEGEPLS